MCASFLTHEFANALLWPTLAAFRGVGISTNVFDMREITLPFHCTYWVRGQCSSRPR